MRHGAWSMGADETGEDARLDAVHDSSVRSYEDLRVWNDAVALVAALYDATRGFPPDERFGLTSQVRRAGVSIPSNIAEGWGRGAHADYVRFLRMARGSLYEVRTQLVIARTIGLLGEERFVELDTRIEAVRRQLHALIGAVERSA